MRQVINRLLAFLLGAVLLAGGLLVIIESVSTWANAGFVWIPGDQWLSTFKTTAWSAPIVIGISAAVGALGFIVVALQSKPAPKRLVPFTTDTTGQWWLQRRSTERRLARRIAAQVPVSPVSTRLKIRARGWILKVKARAASTSVPALRQAAEDELRLLRAPEPIRIRVDARGATKRVTPVPPPHGDPSYATQGPSGHA